MAISLNISISISISFSISHLHVVLDGDQSVPEPVLCALHLAALVARVVLARHSEDDNVFLSAMLRSSSSIWCLTRQTIRGHERQSGTLGGSQRHSEAIHVLIERH